jgi:hypothetical protein
VVYSGLPSMRVPQVAGLASANSASNSRSSAPEASPEAKQKKEDSQCTRFFKVVQLAFEARALLITGQVQQTPLCTSYAAVSRQLSAIEFSALFTPALR